MNEKDKQRKRLTHFLRYVLQEVPLETDTVRQRVRTAERDTELEQEVIADADAATDWLYMDYMDPMTEVARVNLPSAEVTSQQ